MALDPYDDWKAAGRPGDYQTWLSKNKKPAGGLGGQPQQAPRAQYSLGGSNPASTSTGGTAALAYGSGGAYGGGGAAGYGGAGGGAAPGAGGGTASVPELSLKSERSSDLDQASQQYNQQLQNLQNRANQQDQNLNWQIDQYKSRLGEGPTTRAIERSASAVRDMMSGMMEDASTAGAMGGRGQGYQAGAIGEAGQRAAAGAAADISLGRERDKDALTLGGQSIMAAPGQRQQQYDLAAASMAQNPAAAQAQAQYGLNSQNLGLNAYTAQGNLAIQQAANARAQYGSPMDWFNSLYGGSLSNMWA